jgi:hypothetical protein
MLRDNRRLKNKFHHWGSGSLGQMSVKQQGVFEWSYITNSVGGEEVKAASRFKLHPFSI